MAGDRSAHVARLEDVQGFFQLQPAVEQGISNASQGVSYLTKRCAAFFGA